MTISRSTILAVAGALLLLPVSARAQQSLASSAPVEAPAIATVAPLAENAAVGLRAEQPSDASGLKRVAFAAAPTSQSTAMMIVGGAALVVGAIIGDDVGTIFMVGGAVVGLYGLYLYLQ